MLEAKHTPGPWTVTPMPNATEDIRESIFSLESEGRDVSVFAEQNANARLMAAAPELLAYAECEEARSHGEDIAETVLKRHGFNPVKCTAHEFVDQMRRAAIAKAKQS